MDIKVKETALPTDICEWCGSKCDITHKLLRSTSVSHILGPYIEHYCSDTCLEKGR